uniref:Venom S1 protease 18 n=1 Tax=Ectomocoris sp. TaxID=3104572 RepID=A0AB38ZE82_9HEMI
MKYNFVLLSLILLFTKFSVNGKTVKEIKIVPDGKAQKLVPPSSSDGVQETDWVLETNNDCKIRITCRLKVKDCLRATLTINNGKDEQSYCGPKVALNILRSSYKNKMTVSLMTRSAPDSVSCLASAVKSFVAFDSQEIDSSEAGVLPGDRKTTCPCGWSSKNGARIVGGKEALVNEYSFPVVIVRKDIKLAFCGGSIITAYHVLTAAHCTYRLKKGVPLIVGVGEHDLSSVKETNATQIIPVESIINHEMFDGNNKVNDISILVLAKKIKFNKLVGPTCLPNKKVNLEGKFVKVMGWGRLFDHGIQSNVLMKANLKVIDFNQCPEYYKTLRTEDPNQFCTYGHDKDTCTGDSGGPVVWLDPETNRYTQVGLVSYGKGCASEDIPGVNTDVFHFIHWIKKTIQETKPSSICTKE